MYKVLWTTTGDADMLAQLLRAVDKASILRTARRAERLLSQNPREAGEGRGQAARILFVRPLSFAFAIDDTSMTVFVERVRWIGSE